jgi:hypothetical protein
VHLTCGDHTLTLPDGRTLGYSVHGDPDGLPVVNCHGGLVSGHDVSPVHDVARALKVCVVSPDRPGRQPHRAARGSRRVAVGPSGPGTTPRASGGGVHWCHGLVRRWAIRSGRRVRARGESHWVRCHRRLSSSRRSRHVHAAQSPRSHVRPSCSPGADSAPVLGRSHPDDGEALRGRTPAGLGTRTTER